jgi:hypothetical protein
MSKIVQVIRPVVDIRNPRAAVALLLIATASAMLWWNMRYIVEDLRLMAANSLGDSWTPSITLIIVAIALYTIAAIILKYRK